MADITFTIIFLANFVLHKLFYSLVCLVLIDKIRAALGLL